MPDSPQHAETFINDIWKAWEELAPDAVFGEMTLAQFKLAVKPLLDSLADISSLETQLITARQKRNVADAVSVGTSVQVVNGVRSTSKYGPNSALYKAMGYVPDNERKSGLVRPAANKPEPDKQPAPDTKPESSNKAA